MIRGTQQYGVLLIKYYANTPAFASSDETVTGVASSSAKSSPAPGGGNTDANVNEDTADAGARSKETTSEAKTCTQQR